MATAAQPLLRLPRNQQLLAQLPEPKSLFEFFLMWYVCFRGSLLLVLCDREGFSLVCYARM